MARYLLNVVETYRVDSEDEAEALINEAKADGSFELTKYNCEHKEKKAKGDVVDSYLVCKLVKQFNNEKEPDFPVEIEYKGNRYGLEIN